MLVSQALLGLDCKVVLVDDKRYTIYPPTIKKLTGAAYALSSVGEIETFKDAILNADNIQAYTKALSWLINGDESLVEALSNGTPKEITDAIEVAYSLVDTAPFLMLSTLKKNVTRMIAKQKQ